MKEIRYKYCKREDINFKRQEITSEDTAASRTKNSLEQKAQDEYEAIYDRDKKKFNFDHLDKLEKKYTSSFIIKSDG